MYLLDLYPRTGPKQKMLDVPPRAEEQGFGTEAAESAAVAWARRQNNSE